MNEIFKKFSPHLKKALVEAEKIAKSHGTVLDTEHQLLSLLSDKETLAFEILSSFEVTPDRIELISDLIGKNNKTDDIITEPARKSIQLAVQAASKFNHINVGSEHLLLALVSDHTFNSCLILERIGIDPKKIRKQIETIFAGINNTFKDPSLSGMQFPGADNLPMGDNFEEAGFIGLPPMGNAVKTKKESILDQFSVNLTNEATKGKLDPVIGRDREIARLIQTLSRRTKNNPILVGEPGVGKTSIVEGLAQRIKSGNVPEKLSRMEILSIDLGSILAGTMYRGQFEGRIKKILAEIERRGNIILFVDEIHMLVGAGSTEGSIDAANLLKPMLAKGTLRLIGSTTFDEFKKHIEKDPAFERRFQKILVPETTILETIEILQGIKERYENFHAVTYTAEAIKAAAELSARYLNDRFLPDKAIDLIDEAGAAASNKNGFMPTKLLALKKELTKILSKKEKAIFDERYEEATKLREKELILETQITLFSQAKSQTKANVVIDSGNIASLVSDWTGVPINQMTVEEKKNFANLENKIGTFLIGQDEAVREVSKAIKRSRVGIANPRRPIGSFIFLGPTGVGKTEMAKILAREIFGNESSLIRIDMSEFMERHNVSRLVGAPAGYVGYEEGGKLTETVRRNPYSVILFDEIEKAHQEVFNVLLQIMDEGSLTDAKGRKVDFKNTIIIMTSNLGSNLLRQESAIGFHKSANNRNEKLRENVIETVEKTFRPEFINRLDKIVVFMPLDPTSIRRIVDLQCNELKERLQTKGYKISIPVSIKSWIAKKSYAPEFGARPIRKFISDNIETAISDSILSDSVGKEIKLKLENDQIFVN